MYRSFVHNELHSFASFELRRVGYLWLCTALTLVATGNPASEKGTQDAPFAAAHTLCSTGNASTRTLVEIVLGGEGYADERAEIGMPTTDPSQIQMLQAPEDEAACQFLNAEVSVGPDGPKWLKAYYKAGDFYFVALRYQRETLIYFGYGYVLVLNSDLEGLKVFAV